MGMTINTNLSALTAYRNVNSTANDLSKSIEKLSSGLRINRAADDAAGLAISESLKSQVGGLKVAARNAQDGISVVQTAEGSLGEVQSILQRLRDLSVQGANDSNNSDARANIATEATQLVSEGRCRLDAWRTSRTLMSCSSPASGSAPGPGTRSSGPCATQGSNRTR